MLIAGLPRSRTAWLSVFMSQSGTYFYHEAVNGCKSLDEYKTKVDGLGDSTTCTDIIDLHSKAVVIVKSKQEIEDCIQWCNKVYDVDSRKFILSINERLMEIDGLMINQSEINNKLPEIWSHLVDTELQGVHTNMINFNIQVNSVNIDRESAKVFYESLQQNIH